MAIHNASATYNAPSEPKHHGNPNDVKETDKEEDKRKRIRRLRKLFGISEEVRMRREARANKPRSWIERKFIVPIVFGIVGYAWYVYIGRLCVPMLRRDEDARGGRGMGVAFLVVFCLLGLMFWWTYITLILIPPGFARDHVQKTPPPQGEYHTYRGAPAPSASRPLSRGYSHGHDHDSEHEQGSNDDDELIAGTPYSELSPSPSLPASSEGPSFAYASTQSPHFVDVEKQAHVHSGLNVPAASHRPQAPVQPNSNTNAHQMPPVRKLSKKKTHVQAANRHGSSTSHERNFSHSNVSGAHNSDETAVASSSLENDNEEDGAPPHPLPKKAQPNISASEEQQQQSRQPPRVPRSVEDGLPPPANPRRLPLHPILLPEYRYCYTDRSVKPMRAHHCKVCGTCVLMYDHHCPWIGQCVGAHNHKFFLNFLEWSTPWTLWVFSTLLALQIRTDSDIDPQIIVIIALSGIFSLFTSTMLLMHIRMTILNQTSVESLGVSNIRERDRAALHWMVSWWNCPRRRAIKKEWDHEWGELHTEGNIWWLGSARKNWEHRMGSWWVGWFLPLGRSHGDGLTYPTNPRFDKDGRWRRRSEWPPELR